MPRLFVFQISRLTRLFLVALVIGRWRCLAGAFGNHFALWTANHGTAQELGRIVRRHGDRARFTAADRLGGDGLLGHHCGDRWLTVNQFMAVNTFRSLNSLGTFRSLGPLKTRRWALIRLASHIDRRLLTTTIEVAIYWPLIAAIRSTISTTLTATLTTTLWPVKPFWPAF